MSLTVGELQAILDVDASRFDRGVNKAERKLIKLGSIAAAVGGLVGQVFTAGKLVAFGVAAGQAVITMSNLLAALAPAAGILAALPAILVAGAGAAAALKIGLNGVGEALKGDEDALARLSPAAAAVVGDLRGLAGAWDTVRRAVQDRLFENLAGQVRPLADLWLPILQQRLGGIASAFGAMARDAIVAARDPGFVAGITKALDSTWLALARIQDAVKPVVVGLGMAAGVGGPFLERAGAALRDAGIAFGAWLQQASKSGQLQAILDMALTTLKTLGGVLVQVGGIFMAVMSAANTGGGSLLTTIEALLREVNAFLSAGPGKDALVAIFTAIHQVVQAIMPAIGTILGALGQAITLLAPALPPLATAMAAIMTALAPLLPVIGEIGAMIAGILTEALTALTPVIKLLVPIVAQLAKFLAGILGQALKTLVAVLAPVITALAGALAPILPKLTEAFNRVAEALAPLATQLGDLLAQAIADVLPPLLELIPTLIDGLLPAVVELIGAGMEFLRVLLPLLPSIMDLVVALTPLITMVAVLAVQLLTALMPVLIASTQVMVAVAKVIVDVLVVALKWLIKWVIGPVLTAVGWLIDALGWLTKTIRENVTRGLNMLKDLPGSIKAIFNGAVNWLKDAGRSIVNGLWQGIQSMGGWLRDQIGGWVKGVIPDTIAKVLGIASPSRVTRALGRWVPAGLAAGMDAQLPMVEAASRRMAAAAAGGPMVVPAPNVSVNVGGTSVSIDSRAVDDAYVRTAQRRPEVIALAARAGEKRLAFS